MSPWAAGFDPSKYGNSIQKANNVNFSYLNSASLDRLMDSAANLTGAARNLQAHCNTAPTDTVEVVKRADGKFWNVPVATYPNVSQFWKYDPQTYMKQPPYSRTFQGVKKG